MQRCGAGLGLVGVVHTRRWAVQRPHDDCTIGAMMVQRRALRCGSPSGAVCAAVAVVEPCRPHSHGLRTSNSLHCVLGRKLADDGAVRGRLGAIQATAPTVFRYCCARGTQNPPAAPPKKRQGIESLRLLWRCDSVCSGVHWACTLIALNVPRKRAITIAVLVVCRKSKVIPSWTALPVFRD
jgi:hypothetical protein